VEYLDIDRKIYVRDLKEMVCNGFNWLRIEYSADFYGHDNKSSGSLKDGNSLTCQKTRVPAPWSLLNLRFFVLNPPASNILCHTVMHLSSYNSISVAI
jgi:hypothetical protein